MTTDDTAAVVGVIISTTWGSIMVVSQVETMGKKDVGRDSRDCIALYLPPVLNPMGYDWACVLESSGRPMESGEKEEGKKETMEL